jgi:leucyl-tRNA synthetase
VVAVVVAQPFGQRSWALASDKVKMFIGGKAVKKIIVIPQRLVKIVV